MKVVLIGMMCLVLSSCRYEDGPGVSLRSPCARVEGIYDIVKFEVCGADSTLSIISQPCYGKIRFDGDEDQKMYFEGLPLSCLTTGTWNLSNNDNDITIDFKGNFYGIPPFGTGHSPEFVSAKYKILRLTDKEMHITTTYNNLTYVIELEE